MQEIGQTIRGYLRIVFRHQMTLIIFTFFGLMFGIIAAILLPRQYQSSTTILIQEGKTDNPLFSNLAVSTSIAQRAQAVREIMLGWDSLVKLIERLKLDDKVKTKQDYEALVEKLRKDIQISMRDGNLIDLEYETDTAIKAQAVVKNVTDIFIERNVNVQNKETSDAIVFIEEQLHVYRSKIKSSEIVALKDQLNTLLIDSTEAHPMVKQLREQIAKKMEDLKKQNLEFNEEARLNADSTNPMLDQIKKTLDTITDAPSGTTLPANASTDKDIYKVMLIDKLDNVMARDVNVNETIYNSLLQRLETAKITQRLQSSKEGTKYIILDPPRVPLSPSQPNVIMVIIVGIFLGAASGVGVVFLSEFLDKSFLDVQEASQYLGVPLLGAVSKINTQESIEQEKEKNKWLLFWMASGGVLLTAFLIMIKAIFKH